MTTQTISLTPIIDNLEFIGNPFKQKVFTAEPYLKVTIVNADMDLEH